MRKPSFVAVLHSGGLGMAFQPHKDIVKFHGTVSVGKLRDLYRDHLIRSGAAPGEAIAKAEAIRGGFIFPSDTYSGLGFDSPPATEEDNNKRIMSAFSMAKFKSGCFEPGSRVVDRPVRKSPGSVRLDVDAVGAMVESELKKLKSSD